MNTKGRNPNDPIENLAIGKIIEVDGSHVVAELDPGIQELSRIYAGETYPIGQFGSIIKIHFGRRIIYGYVGRLRMKAEYDKEMGRVISVTEDARIIEADLFGEAEWILDSSANPPAWMLQFERGVSTFPLPQQTMYLTPSSELRFIYGHGKGAILEIGEHVGSAGAPCYADLNELLGKHTAILGSTGSGKSGAVAAIIHSLREHGSKRKYLKWRPQIVILDPHNEYAVAFKDSKSLSTDANTLSLPYWLLSSQETFSLFVGKTEFVATSQTNIIKRALWEARKAGALTLKLDENKITIDSPIPYDLEALINTIKAARDPLTASKQDSHNSILDKIEVLRNDARMRFLMNIWDKKTDPFPKIMSQFIGDTSSISIIDLSGVPNEVAGIASAVIARTLFNFKIWQTAKERETNPILLICEEAHRYVPNRGEAQYEAAQEAIRRIAKEGRKYGLGLILVSQRPSEVEETVLSQCNSWIVLRISNDTDREHVKSILPDSLAGLTKVLSGLRRREAIFVGQAAMLPSRIMIRHLENDMLPRSHDIDFDKGWQAESLNEEAIKSIGNRWRFQDKTI
jgi:DNA helicase HerA-like ATPase